MTERSVHQYEFDLGGEELVPMGDLPALYQRVTRLPRRPHRAVCDRWCTRGVDGIPLPTVKVAGRRYSSERAMRWWIVQTTAATAATPPPAAPLSPSQRRALERAGLIDEVQ